MFSCIRMGAPLFMRRLAAAMRRWSTFSWKQERRLMQKTRYTTTYVYNNETKKIGERCFRKLLLWIWRKDALFSQDCVSWTFVDLTWKYFFYVVCYRNGIRHFTMQLPMGEQMWHPFFSKLKRMSMGIIGWEVLIVSNCLFLSSDRCYLSLTWHNRICTHRSPCYQSGVRTPLMLAARYGRPETVPILLAAGARIDVEFEVRVLFPYPSHGHSFRDGQCY